jgi:hypothetical protein
MSTATKYAIFHMVLGLATIGSTLLALIAAGGVAMVLVLAEIVAMIGGAA